jgi:sulfide:quinone oxidoreductase
MGSSRNGQPLRVLLAGGGVAALEAMVALRALAGDRVHIDLLAPDSDFHHRPLATAEPFGAGQVQRFELRGLAHGCAAEHHLGTLIGIDPEERIARTSRGATYRYDELLIAVGARPRRSIPGALAFRGPQDGPAIRALLDDLERGVVRRLVFALPGGVTWPLPLYELALQTAERLSGAGGSQAELLFVTPEDTPLRLLGTEASSIVAGLLAERGVEVRAGSYPSTFAHGRLELVPGGSVAADRVVTLPRLQGVQLAGVPQDADGFVKTDLHGRVDGVPNVYAAGDITTFPIKQGGLSAQQADAVAEVIAARAGAPVTPRPFDPVLRGLLLTGGEPIYLRTELSAVGTPSESSTEPLWWPPAKTSARYLTPYLARYAGLAYEAAAPQEVRLTPPGGPGPARAARARPGY